MLFISSNGLLDFDTPPLLDVISLSCLTADDAPANWEDGLLRTTDALSQISNKAYAYISSTTLYLYLTQGPAKEVRSVNAGVM